VLVSVKLSDGKGAPDRPAVQDAIRKVESALGDRGRVMVRSSGTEPVVRVMVEAPTEAEAAESADRIRAALEA
jgi:phosphoglucosamine mutase